MLKIEIVQDYLSDAAVVLNGKVSITKQAVNCFVTSIGVDTDEMSFPFETF